MQTNVGISYKIFEPNVVTRIKLIKDNMVGASESYVSQILTFVESHLIGFDVNNSNFYGPFFGVVFSNHAISVKMSGDVGGLKHWLRLKMKVTPLGNMIQPLKTWDKPILKISIVSWKLSKI